MTIITVLTQKRLLQIAIAMAGCVPVGAGLMGIVQGPQMIGEIKTFGEVANHFAYLSGLLLAIGLAFWSFIPAIETKTMQVRLLTAIVVIGGLARLYDALVNGFPEGPMLYALGMELIVTPALCWWQGQVSKAC